MWHLQVLSHSHHLGSATSLPVTKKKKKGAHGLILQFPSALCGFCVQLDMISASLKQVKMHLIKNLSNRVHFPFFICAFFQHPNFASPVLEVLV